MTFRYMSSSCWAADQKLPDSKKSVFFWSWDSLPFTLGTCTWKENEDFEFPHHYSKSAGFRLLLSRGSDVTLLKMPLIVWKKSGGVEVGQCQPWVRHGLALLLHQTRAEAKSATPGQPCSQDDGPVLNSLNSLNFFNFLNFLAPLHSCLPKTCTSGSQITPQGKGQARKSWGSLFWWNLGKKRDLEFTMENISESSYSGAAVLLSEHRNYFGAQ